MTIRPSLVALMLALMLALPVAAEPLLIGVFAGPLTCSDCRGARLELTLVRKADGWAEGRYLLKRTGRGPAAATVVTTGDWTTLRGDATDPDAVVYQLEPDRPALARYFVKWGEGRLRVLDAQLKPDPAAGGALLRRTSGLPEASAVDCLRGGGVPGAVKGSCVRPR